MLDILSPHNSQSRGCPLSHRRVLWERTLIKGGMPKGVHFGDLDLRMLAEGAFVQKLVLCCGSVLVLLWRSSHLEEGQTDICERDRAPARTTGGVEEGAVMG